MLSSERWHTGVLGILAGRIARDHDKPCVTLQLQDGLFQGSARSVVGIDLQKALKACAHLLERWGGHKMAAGLCLKPTCLPAFISTFNHHIAHQQHSQKNQKPTLRIHAWLQPQDLNETLLTACQQLEPFGQNAPAPLFALKAITLLRPPQKVGKVREHSRFLLPNTYPSLRAIAWNTHEHSPPPHTPLDLALHLTYHTYLHHTYPQAELIAYRPTPLA